MQRAREPGEQRRWAHHAGRRVRYASFELVAWVLAVFIVSTQIGCGGKSSELDAMPTGDAAAARDRDGATPDGAPEAELGSDVRMQAGEAGDLADRDAAASDVSAPDAALPDAASDVSAPDAALPDAAGGDVTVRDAASDLPAPDASTGVKLVSLMPSNTSLNVRVGQMPGIRVFGLYSDMSKQDVTARVKWASSDTSVVWPPQSANDFFSMPVAGQAILTATLEGVSTTVTMTVSGWGGTLLGVLVEGTKPLMRPGETGQVVLSYYYSQGPDVRITNVPWVSSNPAVLSVEGHGFTTALSAGTATISAVIGDQTIASVLVTVRDVTLSSIILGPIGLTIPFPEPLLITATGVYSDGSKFDLTRKVTWEAPPSIVIDQLALPAATATVQGKVGTYPISASFEQVSASGTLTVPFGSPSSFLIEEPPQLPLGVPPYQMAAYAYYTSDGPGLDVTALFTWSIDDPSVASIGTDGLLHPLSPGTTLVRAAYPGFTVAPRSITVNRAILRSIELSPSTTEVYPNDPPQNFVALGTYDNAQVFDLTDIAVWSTGNAQIASVTNVAGNRGAVTGLKLGTTVVRATVGTVSGSIMLTVAPHDF